MNKSEQTQDYAKLFEIVNTHCSVNVLPVVELLVEQTPDCLEAFCNQAIFTVSELLREDQQGGVLPAHVMQIIQQLHTLREAFRQARCAPSWP